MWTWIEVLIAPIPLIAVPWIVGTAVFGAAVSGPIRWCFAVTASGLVLSIAHALGASFDMAVVALQIISAGVVLARHREFTQVVRTWSFPTHGERIRAVIVDSCNPVLTWPDSAAYQRAFESLDLLVVVDPWCDTR